MSRGHTYLLKKSGHGNPLRASIFLSGFHHVGRRILYLARSGLLQHATYLKLRINILSLGQTQVLQGSCVCNIRFIYHYCSINEINFQKMAVCLF